MKIYNITPILIPYFFFISLFSMADTIYVESTIKSVTVYYQGAEINRSASLLIPDGEHILIFDELPYDLMDDEYQLKSSQSECIVSLKLNKKKGRLNGKSKLTKSLEFQVEELIEESKEIKDKAMILDKKKSMLNSNSQIHASDESVDLIKLEKALEFFDKKLNSIRLERLKLKKRLKMIENEIIRLNKNIQNSIMTTNKNKSQIIVSVSNKYTKEIEVTLSYFLKTAGWVPNYNIKVEEIDQPLTLEFQANIFQTTGEHWDNVMLTLSDSKPIKHSDFPEFTPWYIEEPRKPKNRPKFYTTLEGIVGDATNGEILSYTEIEILVNNKAFKSIVTDQFGVFKINPIPEGSYAIVAKNKGYTTVRRNLKLEKNKTNSIEIGLVQLNNGLVRQSDIAIKPIRNIAGVHAKSAGVAQDDNGQVLNIRGGRNDKMVYFVDGVRVLGTPNIYQNIKEKIHIPNTLNEHQLNKHYKLKSPHQIRSNGEEYTLRIKTVDIPVEYEYYVLAKENPCAFLKGEIINFNSYHLFNGNANIYLKGEYVGQTVINSKLISDTTSLFLGKDNDITVERLQHVKKNKSKYMNNGKVKSDVNIQITIKNHKNKPINLVVADQYPISKHKEINTVVLFAEGAQNNKKTGMVKWTTLMNPHQKKEFNYNYIAKYPTNLVK